MKRRRDDDMETTYGYLPLSYALIDLFISDNPDFSTAEELIQQGADVNNQGEDKGENVLSEILYGYHSNPIGNISLTKIIRFFLDHGFDVTRNEGKYGAQCLFALTYSPFEKEIIGATKILLDAGAKNVPIEDGEPNETPMSAIGTEQSFQSTGEGNHYLGNIYEAAYQIYVALEEGHPYAGIDSFEAVIGKNILGVMAEGNNIDSIFTSVDLPTSKHKNCFYHNIYMIFDGGYLVCTKYACYWVDTAPIDKKIVDVSEFFYPIIEHKIYRITFDHNSIKKGITYYGQPITTFHFDNDVKLTFTINFGEVEKGEYCSYYYYGNI